MKRWLFVFLGFLISLADTGLSDQLSAKQDTGKIVGKVSLNTPAPALPEVVVDKLSTSAVRR